MAYMSAREMLSGLPVKMAEGGPVTYGKGATAADLLAAEEAYLANPSAWTPATAYAAIMESGVSVQDALDAGVAQSTIDAIFTTATPLAGDQLSSQGQTSVIGSGTGFANALTQDKVDAALARYMADGEIDAAERLEMQKVATAEGVTYQDMIAFGLDPNIIYNTPAAAVDPRPCPDGTVYNATTNTCDPITTTGCTNADGSAKTCAEGFTLDASCNCVRDPCPTGQELFNGVCVVVCPTGSARNADGICVEVNGGCPAGQEKVGGICVDVCPEGSARNVEGICEKRAVTPDCSLGGTRTGWSWSEGLGVCVRDTPLSCTLPYKLNTNTQRCELALCGVTEVLNMVTGNCDKKTCGEGQLLDPTTGDCVLDKSCDTGFSWSETESKCVEDLGACGTGYTRNAVTGKCDKDDACGTGKIWDPIALACVTDTTCSDGFTFDTVFGKCVKDAVNTGCQNGMKWDNTTKRCVPIFPEVDTDTGTGAGSATGVVVAQPLVGGADIYGAGEDALDTTFRETPARTEVTENVMGDDQLTGFDYSTAANLLSATGSGFSWTPPSVTSRPRGLMDKAQLDRYTQGRAAQNLRQLTGGDQVSFDRYKGQLGNTGSYGGGLSRSQIFGLMRQQDATERKTAADAAAVTQAAEAADAAAAEVARRAALTDAERVAEDAAIAGNINRDISGSNSTDAWWLDPIDANAEAFNWGGVDMFARGGPVKKPKGSADGGTASADLKALDSSDSLFITEDIVEEVNPDNIQRDIPRMEWDGVERPTNQEASESRSMLENMLSGAVKIPESVGNYFVRPDEQGNPSMVDPRQVGSDIATMGGALVDAVKEDDSFLKSRSIAEIAPITGELISGADALKFSDMANEARASGDDSAAGLYEQLVTLSTAGAVPLLGMGARVGRRATIKAAEEAIKKGALGDAAKMLDEVDAVNAPRADLDFSATVVSKMQEVAARPDVASDPVAMRFLQQIMDDPDAAIAQYAKIGETNGGKIINTDLVRELSPDYLADRTLAFNVHQPASALSELMFNRRVAETMGEEGTWIFTGGGPASGKTAGLSKAAEEAADLVMDGTLAKFAKNDAMIEKALESGKGIQIIYIDRDPLKALPLALMRAMQSGRPVPLVEFAKMHRDARQSIVRLHEKYKDNPKVDIQIVDNQGKMGEQFDSAIDKISEMDYDKTLTEGFRMLEEARLRPEKIGSVDGGINEAIYQGTKGSYDPPAAQSQTSRISQDGTQGNQGNGSRNSSQQTSVNALEVGVDESLSGGQRLRNYTPDNLKTLEELATKATAGTQKADALINAPVEAGSKIGIRLNLNSKIPDAPKGLDKLQTLHKNNFNGKALSYVPYATVENVTFNVNQKGRQGIAAKISNIDVPEAKNKYPAMSVDGNYVPDKNVFLSGKDFVEIGFNPKANHLFIDMNTGQAVKGADLATVVGDRVYARGVQYYKKSEAPEVLSASDGTELPSQVRYKMKRGGSVERVYNDRRYI